MKRSKPRRIVHIHMEQPCIFEFSKKVWHSHPKHHQKLDEFLSYPHILTHTYIFTCIGLILPSILRIFCTSQGPFPILSSYPFRSLKPSTTYKALDTILDKPWFCFAHQTRSSSRLYYNNTILQSETVWSTSHSTYSPHTAHSGPYKAHPNLVASQY